MRAATHRWASDENEPPGTHDPHPPDSYRRVVLTSRRIRVTGLLTAGLLFLAACGGSSSPKKAASDSSSQSSATSTSTTSTSTTTTSIVAAAGTVEAFAGSGAYAVAGDAPGPALGAGLDRPENVAVTSNGDVYIADNDTQRLLRVRDGAITALYTGNTGDGESNTYGVAVAPDDTVWFSNGSGIFKLTGTEATRVVTAGDELQGAPFGLTFDKAGNLYIAEVGGQRVKRYDTSGAMTLIAGTGEQSPQAGGVGDGGPATAAPLGNPVAVAVDDAGNVYVAENFTDRIRKISSDGIISTFAGGGTVDIAAAADGVAAHDILFNTVDSVSIDRSGNIYVADHQGGLIVRFGSDAKLELVAGSATGFHGDGRPPLATALDFAKGMAFDREGTLYFVDALRIRRIKGVA